jgi:excisionase family DNA binding protein
MANTKSYLRNLPLNEMPEMLTVQHVAAYLGLSRNTVYSLYQKNKEQSGLPSFKTGNSRRIRKSALIEWVDSMENSGSEA